MLRCKRNSANTTSRRTERTKERRAGNAGRCELCSNTNRRAPRGLQEHANIIVGDPGALEDLLYTP